MSQRGRPRLGDTEHERRKSICHSWAAEIKRNSGLSAKSLAKELGYGSGNEDADGRAWRALASGSRAPSIENFKRMTALAAKNGWLDPLGWLRYSPYWNLNNEATVDNPSVDEEPIWRRQVFSRVVLMLMSHARQCGVSNQTFFSDARAELDRLEAFTSTLDDGEIYQRALRVATPTAKELLDGPEYPTTSLAIEDN